MGATTSPSTELPDGSEITRIPLGGLTARRDGGILWSVQRPCGEIVIGGLSTGTVAALAYVSESLDIATRTIRANTPIMVNAWDRSACPACGLTREPEAAGTARCGDCRAVQGAVLLLGRSGWKATTT